MLLLLLSTILLPFLSYDALSFRFEKLPVIPRRSSLIARSFILDKSNEDYQQRLHVENQRAPYDHPVEFSDKLINPMAVMSDGIPLRKNSLYRRIEETMEFAGFESPMHSSGRNTIIFLLVLYSIKILRNKFLLKGQSKLNEFQPTWGHVVTSKEEEVNLHAYTCKKCGATIFIAKGREWRFFNPFVECTNCGAKGKENFYDRRKEIVDEVDDGTFIYESFVDYNMSKRAQKKIMEEKKRIEEQQKKFEAEEAARLANSEGESDVAEVAVVEKFDVEKEEEGKPVEEIVVEQVKVTEPKPAPKIKSRPAAPSADLDVLDMDG